MWKKKSTYTSEIEIMAGYIYAGGWYVLIYDASTQILFVLISENLFIGYSRIVLGLISFYFMPFNPTIAATCYLLSGFLDAFDGHAARMLNQCEWELQASR